ncbi:hypothetical protein [Aquibacillus saliphilus]|uniref:hypothetical protein n=1 Tax=Aquibacillus saliphilus TaxID=1909422 RepID=UPI001CF08837|nr:hypothetical protein [Aquibacillus saliphilus]
MAKFRTIDEDEVIKLANKVKFSYKYKIPFLSKAIRNKANDKLYEMIDDEIMESVKDVMQDEMDKQFVQFMDIAASPIQFDKKY